MTLVDGVTHASTAFLPGGRVDDDGAWVLDVNDPASVSERWGRLLDHQRPYIDPAARLVSVALAGLSTGFGWAVDEHGAFSMWRLGARHVWVSAEWLERWGPRAD